MDRMQPTPTARPLTLRSQVEEFLRRSIMTGRFAMGERLVERELCEMLGVSRPSVREALRALEAEKLVTIIPNKGPIVTLLTREEAGDLYALRALLEGYATREFTRLASDGEVERLGEAVTALHEEAAGGDRDRLLAAKARFYEIIFDGCGNRLVKEFLSSLFTRINLLRATSFSRPERLAVSLREIDGLYDRIRSRDLDGAQKAAEEHILNARAAALPVLDERRTAT